MKDPKEIKKEGKTGKEGKNHFVLIAFIAIVLVILLFLFYKAKTTGKAYDAVELKSQVEQFVNGLPFDSMIENTKICVAIEVSDNETAVFEAVKSGTYSVTQNYCMAPDNSDITIRFLSYEKFLKYANGNADFKSGLNIDYDFSPSIYVKPGGAIDSNTEFRDKYYGAINYILDRNEIKSYGMENLLYENLNKEQQNALKENLPAEQFEKIKGTTSTLELPFIGSTNPLMLIIVLVAIVAVLSIIIYTVSTMSKTKLPKEVIDYIRKLRQSGYSDETTKQVLLNAGWAQKDVEKALKVK